MALHHRCLSCLGGRRRDGIYIELHTKVHTIVPSFNNLEVTFL